MQRDEFIAEVRERAHLGSWSAAEEAVRATTATLAERIDPGLANDLAAQLPSGIADNVHAVTSDETAARGGPFDREEFVARVGQRAHTGVAGAGEIIRVVCEVLDEATSGGVMDRIRLALPEDLRHLTLEGTG